MIKLNTTSNGANPPEKHTAPRFLDPVLRKRQTHQITWHAARHLNWIFKTCQQDEQGKKEKVWKTILD